MDEPDPKVDERRIRRRIAPHKIAHEGFPVVIGQTRTGSPVVRVEGWTVQVRKDGALMVRRGDHTVQVESVERRAPGRGTSVILK